MVSPLAYDQQRLAELDSLIIAKKETRIKLEEQIESLNERVKTTLATYEEHVSGIPKLRKEKMELLAQIQGCSSLIASQEADIARLKGEKAKFEELGAQILTLKDEHSWLTREKESLTEQRNQLLAERQTLDLDIRQRTTRISELQSNEEYYMTLLANNEQQSHNIDEKLIELSKIETHIAEERAKNEKALTELNSFPNSIGYYLKGLQAFMDKKGWKMDVMKEIQKM